MVLTVVFAVPGLLWAESNDPQAAVQELLGEIRQIKKNLSGQEKADNQKHAHSALVWLNVAEISKKALGKHWAKCSDSEQKRFQALLGELFDRIAAIKQHPFLAINKSNLAFTRSRRNKARVVCEHSGCFVESRNIDNGWTLCSIQHRKFNRFSCCVVS